MNLTSKRMLQFALLCAGVCVMSATAATQYIADSFENNPGDDFPATNGLPIVYYKATNNGFGVPMVTNWVTAAGDASKIVDADVVNQAYMASPRPMAGAVSNLVLNLETEGQTLTRTAFASPQVYSEAAPVYVDTLIKFTPSEDTPVISDPSVKAAVFVNVFSNLCVFHGVDGAGNSPVSTATTIAINPEQWYRLTIQLTDFPGEAADLMFQVYLDGEVVLDDDALDNGGNPGGSYFYAAANQNTLSAVAFQGTGMVDELVVADDVTLSFSSAVLLTLSFDDTKVGVTAASVPVLNGGTVATGTEIVIDANDWYEITSVTGGSPAYTGASGALVNVSTGVVADTVSSTITIAVQPFSGMSAISTGLGGSQPANKVAAWALANSLGAGDLTGAMLDDYLLNKAPGTNPTLEIKALVVDPVTQIATVTVGTIAANVAFDTINGTVKVQTRDALGTGDWSASITVPVTINAPTTTVDVEVDLSSAGASYFIKAVVE